MRPLSEVLPLQALGEIAKQFRDGVDQAIDSFEDARGDEDTVTGGLIQSIKSVVRGTVATPSGPVRWQTRFWKLRGRGKGAPEKRIGADAIFEIEVLDEDGVLTTRKSLPMQAKRNGMAGTACLAVKQGDSRTFPAAGLSWTTVLTVILR